MTMRNNMTMAILSVSLAVVACHKAGDSTPAVPDQTPAAESPSSLASIQSVVAPAPASVASAAPATGVCVGADTQLTDARTREYASLVAGAIEDGKVKPAEVKINSFLQQGTWSTVFASIPIADPGYFVFETVNGTSQFKDVWAGLADEGDRVGLTDWANKLGAPKEFSDCFAQTVIGG